MLVIITLLRSHVIFLFHNYHENLSSDMVIGFSNYLVIFVVVHLLLYVSLLQCLFFYYLNSMVSLLVTT